MREPTPSAPAGDAVVPGGNAVILGGGVAGLAAALRLAQGGKWRPRIFEREDRPGGLARSLNFKGIRSDLGPHRIHTEIPEVRQLIEEIAAPSLYTVQRRSHIYLRGKYLPYPPDPVAMARHLGPLRMAGFMASFAAERIRPPRGEETYESLMRRAFGKGLWDFLLRPYSEKTWKTDPALLHADTARVRVSAGSLARMVMGLLRREKKGEETALREFRYVRGGAQTLVGHLAAQATEAGASLETGRPVEGFDLDASGRVTAARIHGAHGGAVEPVRGDVYLSTAPLPVLLGDLLPATPQLAPARAAAEGLRYLDMIFVFVIVGRPVITGDNWLYFPEREFIFNRGYEAKSFDASMVPDDRSVLCLEITVRPGDPLNGESDEAIAREATAQAASTGIFREDEVVERVVYRIPFAYPIYSTDYRERLAAALDGVRRLGNLVTLGRQGLFNHNNMDHSIYMGLVAGDTLNTLPAEAAVAAWYDGVDRFKTMRIVD